MTDLPGLDLTALAAWLDAEHPGLRAGELSGEVLAGGKVLIPNMHFFDERGTCLFISHDWNSGWRERERPPGIYTSTVWIPGNFLAEGTISVLTALSTYKPLIVHFVHEDSVAFTVVDSLDGDSARGDYAGLLPGVVRPVLEWTNDSDTP